MTDERKQEAVLAAVVFSAAVHALLMFLAEPQVMTHVAGMPRAERRQPMKVAKADELRELMRMSEVADVEASKEAPAADAAAGVEVPRASGVSGDDETPAPAFEATAPAPVDAMKELPARFDADSLKSSEFGETAIPVATFETPSIASAGKTPLLDSAPSGMMALPVVGAVKVQAVTPPPDPPAEDKAEIRDNDRPKVDFTPSETVYEKVDAKIVESEKAAVRELMSVADAAELKKFVNTAMLAHTEGGWTYFKVMITARNSLETVPKDVVVLIDASGSIGRDRMRSIRSAVKELLRSAVNSGDRFNLVAFRNRYTYAFRTWQRGTESSFERSDRWLGQLAAHGRTDVFATISSVLTLPRDPERPLIALVITDGEANAGVSDTAEILSKFTALNDGLVSVYMYGVKSSANRELIDVLTRGNRGEGYIQSDFWKSAGSGVGRFAERFRDPVLSDIRLVFSSATRASAYPRLLKNLYRGDTLEIVGRVPAGTAEVAFSLRGLNARDSYEGFFRCPLIDAPSDPGLVRRWNEEHAIDAKLK